MIERLLITLLLMGIGIAAYILLKNWQLHRANRLIATSGQSSVIYFRSDHCGPCRIQGQFLQKLQDKLGERVVIEKIDADRDADKAANYGIFTLPTTLIVDRTGKVKHANYGLADVNKLHHQLMNL